MKIDFGIYRGKDIRDLPKRYLETIYKSYKPQILEIERVLQIFPREKRADKVVLDVLFSEYQKRFPDNDGLKRFHEAVLNNLFKF